MTLEQPLYCMEGCVWPTAIGVSTPLACRRPGPIRLMRAVGGLWAALSGHRPLHAIHLNTEDFYLGLLRLLIWRATT